MCVWSEGGQLSFPVPWPGIKPMPPVLGARSLNHWTIREAPIRFSLDSILKSTFLHKPVTWDYLIQPSFLAECKSLGVINRKNTSLIEYLWLTLGKERQSMSGKEGTGKMGEEMHEILIVFCGFFSPFFPPPLPT